MTLVYRLLNSGMQLNASVPINHCLLQFVVEFSDYIQYKQKQNRLLVKLFEIIYCKKGQQKCSQKTITVYMLFQYEEMDCLYCRKQGNYDFTDLQIFYSGKALGQ